MQDIIYTGLVWSHFGRKHDIVTIGEWDPEAVVACALSYCWMAFMHGPIDALEADLKAELTGRGSPDIRWTEK